MALSPTVEEQELLADTWHRSSVRLPLRERVSEAAIAVAYGGAVAGVWLAAPPGRIDVVPAVLALLVLVLATRVRFDTPFGFTVATQLAFVPLLFALPIALVPLAVAAALALASLPEVLARKSRPRVLLFSVGNSWFAIGPVLVFALSDTAPLHAGAGLLLLALAAQFAVDIVVSGVRCWVDREAGLAAQLRESWVYGIDAALSGMALAVAEEVHRTPLAAIAPLPVLALLAVFARERHDRIASLLELNAAYRGTALVLGDVVEADDGYTGEHSRGVVQLAIALGRTLRLSGDQLRNLEFGALLHDVGKIAIPNEIINKPAKLDAEEWRIIETHTLEGQRMLDRIGGFMSNVGRIVRSHHERWDGRGYPDGLAGEAIPLESRIIACCDAWHAMRTDRSYRKALSSEVARAEMTDNSGRQFDPLVVQAFLGLLAEIGEDRAPAPAPNAGLAELPR